VLVIVLSLFALTVPAPTALPNQTLPPQLVAPQPADAEVNIDQALASAQQLVATGQLKKARKVLEHLSKRPLNGRERSSEVQFLLGLIDVEERRYSDAIHTFRRLLLREPTSPRVRLELARAFFLAKDYDNAERQFRFALAGGVPPAVAANIDLYLSAIRQARQFSYTLSLGVAPDTNINAGPTVTAVTLYGLPFTLSSNARRESGVGIAADGSGEWAPTIGEGIRLRMGAQFHVLEYSSHAFDDRTMAAYSGPRIVRGRWDVSPLITGFQRWYGQRFYNGGLGGALQATFYPAPRMGITGSLGAQAVHFAQPVGQSGPAYSGSIGSFYTVDPASTVTGSVSVNRQNAELNYYSNTTMQLNLGYFRDLPAGFSASLEIAGSRTRYDSAFAAFGSARNDKQLSVRTTLLNRKIDIGGFTPRLVYNYIHNSSNINIYEYDRNRVEVGLTRIF